MAPTVVTAHFSDFTASNLMPAPQQIVGLQWQVNAAGGECTVELRIDDVGFIPVTAPPTDASAAD
jgi:hypothetical protein